MFKTVYDFTKMFSILFIVSGLCFIFQENYYLATLTIGSYLLIRFIDSDWAFENFNFPNPNLIVIIFTYILIVINVVAIYGEMETSPLMARLNQENKEEYLKFEDMLLNKISDCTSSHNYIVAKVKAKSPVYASEVKKTNSACSAAIQALNNVQVPDTFKGGFKALAKRNVDEFKKIAINLSTFGYSANTPALARVHTSHNNAVKNMKKLRKMVGIQGDFPEDKANFVKF